MNLAERYPGSLVNGACTRALADGIYSYRHVKAATERLVAEALAAIEHAQATPVQGELALTQEHPLIRCADDYAELFAQGAAQLSEPGCAGAPPTATTTSATATAVEPKA